MSSFLDLINTDERLFRVRLSGEDSCYFDVNYSRANNTSVNKLLEYTYTFDVTCYDNNGNEVGDIYFDIIDTQAMYVEDVEVIKKIRHNGYGAKMLQLAECVAREMNMKRVDGLFVPQNIEKAKFFYSANGYKLVKRGSDVHISKPISKSLSLPTIIVDEVQLTKEENELDHF